MRIKKKVGVIIVTLAWFVVSNAFAGELANDNATVPPEKALAGIAEVLDISDIDGTYLFYSRVVISKKNGKGKKTEETVVRVRKVGDDNSTELISYKENGVDKTEDRRKEYEKARKELEEKSDGKSTNTTSFKLDLRAPTPEYRDQYSFSVPEADGDLLVSSFEPQPSAEKQDEMVTGRIAWHPQTGELAWIETVPVHNPKYIDELWLRSEFKRIGGRLLMVKNVTRGMGGFLVMKRRFELEFEVREYEPAPAAAAGGAVAP